VDLLATLMQRVGQFSLRITLIYVDAKNNQNISSIYFALFVHRKLCIRHYYIHVCMYLSSIGGTFWSSTCMAWQTTVQSGSGAVGGGSLNNFFDAFTHIKNRVARWFIFKPKNPNLG
jgi:hypothetical protein